MLFIKEELDEFYLEGYFLRDLFNGFGRKISKKNNYYLGLFKINKYDGLERKFFCHT